VAAKKAAAAKKEWHDALDVAEKKAMREKLRTLIRQLS